MYTCTDSNTFTHFANGTEHKPKCNSRSRPLLSKGIMTAVIMKHMATF